MFVNQKKEIRKWRLVGGGRFCEAGHTFTLAAGGRVMNNGKKNKVSILKGCP